MNHADMMALQWPHLGFSCRVLMTYGPMVHMWCKSPSFPQCHYQPCQIHSRDQIHASSLSSLLATDTSVTTIAYLPAH